VKITREYSSVVLFKLNLKLKKKIAELCYSVLLNALTYSKKLFRKPERKRDITTYKQFHNCMPVGVNIC